MGFLGKSFGGNISSGIKETISSSISSGGPFGGECSGINGINIFDSKKERQAHEYIREARQYVSEGEEIYDEAYRNVSEYASETEYKLRQHFEYKQMLAKELGTDIGNTLKSFSNFNIDSKVVDAPTINGKSSGVDINLFKTTFSDCVKPNEGSSIFDMILSEVDFYDAKRKRDEAKQFKERMKMERNRLKRIKEQMSEIQSFIISEKSELDSLMGKVRKMAQELNSGLLRNSFSREEAEYLKGIHKITEHIANLLSTQFLTDSLSITSKYQQVYDGVKLINQNLPSTPSIHDRSTLYAIKRIVAGTIVMY